MPADWPTAALLSELRATGAGALAHRGLCPGWHLSQEGHSYPPKARKGPGQHALQTQLLLSWSKSDHQSYPSATTLVKADLG